MQQSIDDDFIKSGEVTVGYSSSYESEVNMCIIVFHTFLHYVVKMSNYNFHIIRVSKIVLHRT